MEAHQNESIIRQKAEESTAFVLCIKKSNRKVKNIKIIGEIRLIQNRKK